MNNSTPRTAQSILSALATLVLAGCATTGGVDEEFEPTLMESLPHIPGKPGATILEVADANEESKEKEGEVPLAVAETEQADRSMAEVVVQARIRHRHEAIHDLVTEAQDSASRRRARLRPDRKRQAPGAARAAGRLRAVERRPTGMDHRPAGTSASADQWKPGRKPLAFRILTPGIEARHVKGTGAERLMFAFSRDGEPLKVYGRKFPVFDNNLVKRRRWAAVVETAKPIVYLPFTEDTFDPAFRQRRQGIPGRYRPARRSRSCDSRMRRARRFPASCSPTPFRCRSSRRSR